MTTYEEEAARAAVAEKAKAVLGVPVIVCRNREHGIVQLLVDAEGWSAVTEGLLRDLAKAFGVPEVAASRQIRKHPGDADGPWMFEVCGVPRAVQR